MSRSECGSGGVSEEESDERVSERGSEGVSGGLFSDGQVVFEHLSEQEAEFLYHEIFVHESYMRSGRVSECVSGGGVSGGVNGCVSGGVSECVSEGVEIVLQDGDCVVDIGANIGLFSLHCVSRAHSLTVLACEPVPHVCDVMRRNLHSYKCSHDIRVLPCAVGRECVQREVFLFDQQYPGESCRWSRRSEARRQQAVVREARSNVSVDRDVECVSDAVGLKLKLEEAEEEDEGSEGVVQQVHCPVLTLQRLLEGTLDECERCECECEDDDEWCECECEESEPMAVDLLKIDCEGDELEVLLGIDDSCAVTCRGEDCSDHALGAHSRMCLWRRIRQIVIGE
jgi:FkbM family methyltransferase